LTDSQQDASANGAQQSDFSENVIQDGHQPIREGSDITRGQAVVLLMSFILRHQLSGVAVGDLLDLFAILAPDVCLPSSKFLLNKGLFDKNSCVQVHMYCPFCDAYIGRYSADENCHKCEICDIAVTREVCLNDGYFYLYVSIEQQLRTILKTQPILRKTDFHDPDNLTSILSGCILQSHLSSREIGDDDITLIWNCDGAPVFSSSKKSIWPLQACVNELPASRDNLLLIGLWFGKQKPLSHTYLKPFVEELKHLGSHGMQYVNSDNDIVTCKVFSVCCSSDSCARPLLRETTQFNGRYGCDWCLMEGQTVKRGDGISHVYAPSRDELQLRDSASFANDALHASADNPINGIKGVTPVLFLPMFDVISGFVPDYLHCVLLGVVRTFAGLWFDSSNHEKPWYIRQSGLSAISKQLITARPPSDISRLPRTLNERKFWKGSEWKSFLLYYSLLVLNGQLPSKYLNHWFLLVYAMHILLRDTVCKKDVSLSQKVLLEFVVGVHTLYGLEYCTFNVHQLLHFPAAVLNWGPLWAFSCFRFEDNIGQILSLVKGSNCVPMQVFRSFTIRKTLPELYSKYCAVPDVRLRSFLDRLWCSGIYVRQKSVIVDNVHLYGCPVIRTLTLCESLAISRLTGFEPKDVSYRVYQRLYCNSFYLTASDYKTSNRHCDDTVQLTDGRFCIILCCVIGQLLCRCSNACYCTDNALLLVNFLDKIIKPPLFRNNKLSISSDAFIFVTKQSPITSCVVPSDVSGKCCTFADGATSRVIPLLAKTETD